LSSFQFCVFAFFKSLFRLNDAYYAPSDSKGAPASDAVYDTMVLELRRLEQKHQALSPTSPTEVVGSPASSNALPKVPHVVPMLSLANAYTGADLVDFHTSVSRAVSTSSLQYIAELKYDGMAAALIYQNGTLQSVLSRGDGRLGEDITAAALKLVDLQYLPRSLPPPLNSGRVEIRCEMIMSNAEFLRANANSDRSNARNWCAGLLLSDESKLQSKSDVELPKLALFVYGLLDCSADTHSANMQMLRASGFHINHLCHSFEVPVVPKDTPASEQAWIHAIEIARQIQIDFDTDGVVFKLDSVALQQQLSSTARTPRWAVAFKWPTVQATTTLLSVDLQVGNHGRLTPVANLAPVKIDGVVVKRATLHNIASALKADLRVGQTVKVQRAGGVIPQVVVFPNNHDASGESAFARHRISATALRCPCAVGCAVEIDPLEVNASCTHPKCRPRAEQLIIHFCSKSAGVNIEGMGDASVKALMDAGLIGQSVVDVFALVRDPQASAGTVAKLSELPRWGTKKAENLVNAIIKARNEASGDHLLAALGMLFHCVSAQCDVF
jgi:DNA ligase (NAD+)